jgi:hypothetical protein
MAGGAGGQMMRHRTEGFKLYHRPMWESPSRERCERGSASRRQVLKHLLTVPAVAGLGTLPIASGEPRASAANPQLIDFAEHLVPT